MNYSEKITRKNTRIKIVGMSLIAAGIVTMMLAAIYILNASTASVLATESTTTSWVAANSYEIGILGFLVIIIGILLKWRAEDSHERFEKTNRYSAYE